MARIVRALLATVFASQPNSPELGKWTRLGPALDRLFLGSFLDFYRRTFSLAFQGGKSEAITLPEGDSTEATFVEEQNWQAMRGRRVTSTLSLLDNVDMMRRVAVLSLAAEPVRVLLRCFFTFARESETPGATPAALSPPICTLTSAMSSPVVRVLEYISSFLAASGGPRLSLLLVAARVHSHTQLWRDRQGLALQLRRALLLVAGWIHRRLAVRFTEWPFKLAQVVDVRVPHARRTTCAEAVFRSPLCCLDRHFARRLRVQRLATSPDDLMSSQWQASLLSWAWRCNVTNAQIEFRHSAQKHLTPSRCTSWHRFVSRSLCHEMARAHQAEKLQVEAAMKAALPAEAALPALPASRRYDANARATGPLQQFHQRSLHENPGISATSKEHWAKVKQEWSELPADSADRRLAELSSQAAGGWDQQGEGGREQRERGRREGDRERERER